MAVVKPMSYKYFFALEVKRDYRIRHMDIVIAFLYSFHNKVIYIEQLHLFTTELNKICKLINALYGLKQAPHVCYKIFVKFLKKLKFTQLEYDHSIFVSANKQLFIAIYINDLLIFGLEIPRLEDV